MKALSTCKLDFKGGREVRGLELSLYSSFSYNSSSIRTAPALSFSNSIYLFLRLFGSHFDAGLRTEPEPVHRYVPAGVVCPALVEDEHLEVNARVVIKGDAKLLRPVDLDPQPLTI